MHQGCKEAWITAVNEDDSVFSALALAQSIRETYSFKDIVALYGPKLTSSKRDLLANGFDKIVPVGFFDRFSDDDEWNTCAKIFCWSITDYRKIVFLDYNSLVLKNCYILFEKEGFAITNSKEIIAMSLIPSITNFHEFTTEIGFPAGGETKDTSLEQLCRKAGFIDFKKSYICSMENRKIFIDRPCVLVFGEKFTSDMIKGVANAGYDTESDFMKFWEYRTRVVQKVLTNISQFQSNNTTLRKATKEPIAIVGMSFRLPGANNAEEFWNLMMSHGDAMREVPSNRWTPEQSCLVGPQARKLKGGYLKDPIDEFDGMFFGISPAELSFVDPQQRLILEITWEALEDAAIPPSSLEGTNTGVFTGQWTFDYRELLHESGFRGNDFYRPYMGNGDGMTASRIAHFLGLSGRNIAAENGCSSSMVAVGLAVQSLQNHESIIALVGGVNLLVQPYEHDSINHVLSKDGHCKPFEEGANGFARAEGCGVFVLKRMSDAVKDHDRMYAVIKGYGVSQEGLSSSLGTPTVQCEAAAMRMALDNAGVQPHEVSFVEAHGTGTSVGDPLEVKAIASVYGQDRTNCLVIGSVKANVGHTESCSGITGIIKTVLAFEHELIPPQRTLKKLNPKINLSEIPAIISLEPVSWKKDSLRPRIAGVSSFGISGTDCHVILQEAPIKEDCLNFSAHKDELNILTFSAKTQDSLNILLTNYFNYLQKTPYKINDVAYTANTGRTHFKYRAAITARSLKEVSDSILNNQMLKGSCEKKPNICFVFPGQGWEYQEMGKSLYNNNELFRDTFNVCEKIIQSKTGRSIKDSMCNKSTQAMKLDILVTELSIFTIQYCLVQLWKSLGIKPDCILGINVGEYAAATFAEILKLEDAIMLLEARSKFLIKMPYDKIIVVNENEAKTNQLVKEFQKTNKGYLEIAEIISLHETTLLGSDETIMKFNDFCSKNGVNSNVLEERISFYSKHADSLLDEFRNAAKRITYLTPKYNYISSVFGVSVDRVDTEYWVNHLTNKVLFHDATRTATSFGCNLFIELGSYPLLSESILANSSLSYIESINQGSNEHKTIIKAVAKLYVEGVDIAWPEFYTGKHYNKVPLPHYPFERNKYWFDFEASTSPKELSFHPLVGCTLDNPGVETIYQNQFQLQSRPYIEDHKVGDYIIYPGSAYLEMTLMAGYASQFSNIKMFEFPDKPIIINNFLITTALEIQPDKTLEFHTIVAESKDNSVKDVKIYSRKRTLPKSPWIGHSEGSFLIKETSLKENIETCVAKIKLDMNAISEKTLYTNLSELGYNFGPRFQSLKSIWRNASGVLAEVIIPQDGFIRGYGYLCHPIATDAMIQSSLIVLYEKIDCLHLPISIQKFVFYKTPKKEKKYYIYAKKNSEDSITTVLINKAGDLFCSMDGVGFAKTTVTEFQKRFKNTKNQDLPIITEEWNSIPVYSLKITKPFLPQNQAELCLIMEEEEELIEVIEERQRLNKGISMKLLSLLLTMGWKCPNIDNIIIADKIIKNLGIVENGRWIIRRFLEMLEEDGYLEKINKEEFKVIKAFPSETDLDLIVSENIDGYQTGQFEHERACALTFLSNILKLFTGKVLPLPLLFPEDDQSFSAEYLYSESAAGIEMSDCLTRAVEFYLKKIMKNATYKNETIKFLEIGSGTGRFSKKILPMLARININYLYSFTDISSGFLPAARKQFEEYGDKLEFSTLNIEEDPKLQGFSSNDYDIVIASYVLHATKDLSETCRNVRNLLKNFGMFFMTDLIVPQRHLDISFGFLEGYYNYTDKNLRPHHCLISAEAWTNLLLNSGFSSSCSFKRSAGENGLIVAEASKAKPQYKLPSHVPEKTWIVFHDGSEISDTIINDLQTEDRKVFSVNQSHKFTIRNPFLINLRFDNKHDFYELYKHVASESNLTNLEGIMFLWNPQNSDDFKSMPHSLFYTLQTTLENITKNPPNIFVVTRGHIHLEDQEPTIPTSSAMFGMIKSFSSENAMFKCKMIDLDPSDQKSENPSVKMLLKEIWKLDQEPFVAFRGTNRYLSRLIVSENDAYAQSLALPSSSAFQLELPKSNQIDDLKFTSQSKPLFTDDEVLVEIKAAALNFRDIFNVLKPSKEFETSNFVGSDFAGVVIELGKNVTSWNIGDIVIGCTFHSGSVCSHITLAKEHLISLPETMSYAEGATLPTVFATAHHCLVTVAQIKAGDNVLIHTGSGGVGLCAIEICLGVGANIFTTASSKRKQTYLKNLGIKHVFSSRNLDFSKHILNLTDNKGVNVILNTLTGPGFKEASLDCCAMNGRFIEISKLNVWSSSEVSQLRKDVKYSIEDLSIVDFLTWKGILATLDKYLKTKQISPIAFTQFCFLDIRKALKYLEKARQIGKVVCVRPRITQTNNAIQVSQMFFNDKGTYLVTGGTRGVGFEVAKWMLKFGAKHILLCSRSIADSEILKEINKINSKGNNIVVKQCDISNFEHCDVLLNYIAKEMPKLKGIMHSAGVLSDGVIQNLTWEDFETTMNPKVKGAWNLHCLTKNVPLEHFVMFSSIVSIFGSPGQSSHSAANSFLDALAHYRNAMGLSATSINWGQWGETGVAVNKTVYKGAINPFTNAQGLEALKKIMSRHLLQAISYDGDVNIIKDNFPWLSSYTEKMKEIGDSASKDKSTTSKVSAAELWNEINKENDANNRYEIVLRNVLNVVANTLKLKKAEQIEIHGDFRQLGVDSLMMIEIRNHLQSLVGTEFVISANDMADSSTIDMLTKKIMQIIFEDKVSDVEGDRIKKNIIIREDAKLWDHIQGNGSPIKASDIKTVLLLGSTGYLGAYVLRNISHRRQVLKIYCLLRGKTPEEEQHRLHAHLKEIQVFNEINMANVEIINGDIAEEKFGLSKHVYEELAKKVDAVINCAVFSNHLLEYPKRESKIQTLRTVNVTGTQRILEFACCKRTKLVYHSSSLLALWKMEGNSITEDWPDVGDFDDGINYGYAISKHISDKLVHEAVINRNIPCKVFRFPKISGDSRTGRQFVEGDHFLLRLMHFIKTGCIPDIDIMMQLLPVDICADISLDVFFKEGVPSDVFNMLNPHNQNEKLVSEVAKSYDRTVNLVSYEKFIETLIQEGRDSFLFKWADFYTREDALFKLHENRKCPIPFLDVWKQCPENCFAESKIYKIFPQLVKSLESSLDILRRDVKFAVDNYPNFAL